MGARRGMGWPVESFTLYDDDQVNVELVSAHLTVTQPQEVAMYAQSFADLNDLPQAHELELAGTTAFDLAMMAGAMRSSLFNVLAIIEHLAGERL